MFGARIEAAAVNYELRSKAGLSVSSGDLIVESLVDPATLAE
jgi:hypothetical protein